MGRHARAGRCHNGPKPLFEFVPQSWAAPEMTADAITLDHNDGHKKHMTLFDGVSGVREWMVAAYKPELAATLGSCMQDMMHGLKTGLDGQPNVTPAS